MTTMAFADTNVLLDIMIPEREGCASATALMLRSAQGVIDVAVCAGSLKGAYYIARRDLPEPVRRRWIAQFLDAFCVLPIDERACRDAVNSDEPDFEDGIIRQCAESWQADWILSRDGKAFRNCAIPHISCDALLMDR